MDNEIDREHRTRNASGGSNLGWGRVSAATNIQITYRLLMLYLGIIQGSGVLWWYGADSVSPASNCPVYHRQNCRKLTIIIRIRGGLLRPRPDGGDPAPPPQPAAVRPAGGAPQYQRARAKTELHTGGMSWYYTSYCHVMSWSQVGEVRASVMDTVMDHMMDLDTLDTGEEADNGDDMDEMNMPNPGKRGY